MKEITKVEPHFIAYFDILGYKEAIKDNQNILLRDISKAMDRIEDIVRKVNLYMSRIYEMSNPNDELELEVIPIGKRVFSDNVLLYAKVTGNDLMKLYHLLGFITTCGIVQQECLLRYGLLIRGSITMGDFYQNETFLFGQSLIRAYELESSIAVYPRIVIDKPCIDLFSSCNDESSVLLAFNRLKNKAIFNDKDGIAYVNYLGTGQNNKIEFEDRLERHKEKIVGKIEAVGRTMKELRTSNDKIFYKLSWIANYHNEFCKKYEMENHSIKEV
ncbi:MAG: hypothetical protein ACIAQZ_16120 [Sedimentisphaeraceae bacterium JB056]